MTESKNNLQIIILAAGKSKRMGGDTPKALAELKNKPFLRHILDTLEKLDLVHKPIIVVGHKKEEVMDKIGPQFLYAVQHEQLGTGHAVKSAQDLTNGDHKTILVLSADQPLISTDTIEKIIEEHTSKNATITLGTVQLPDFNEWRSGMLHFGRIVRSEDGKVEKIVEYKDATEEEENITEVNPAIYAFDAAWLWQNIEKLKNENAQQEYYLTDLIHAAFEDNQLVLAVPVANMLEGLQPNTKEELAVLEGLI